MKDWQQRLMGKAMTVTDTKTLWGKDPDKSLHSQFSHIFVWTIKTKPGGGHFYINLYGTCHFSGIIFQHKFMNLV